MSWHFSELDNIINGINLDKVELMQVSKTTGELIVIFTSGNKITVSGSVKSGLAKELMLLLGWKKKSPNLTLIKDE